MRLLGKLKQKTEGASTYVATMICIFAMFLMFLALFLNYSQIVGQNKVERVYRQYLLRMEREGYLTDSDRASLVTELTALGVENISLSGTSLSAVGYGNEVRLCITGQMKVDVLKFTDGKPGRGEDTIDVNINKTGTALY